MDCRKWGLALVVTGVIGQVAGLALDASLHGADESLLGRGGAFTFSNVGHALLFAGLALAVAGVGLVLAGPYLYGTPGRPPASRLTQLVGPLALVALLAGGAILADGSSSDRGTADGGSGSAGPVRVAAAVAHRDASGGVHQHTEGAPVVVGSGPAATGIEVANGSSPCEQSGPPVSEGQAAGGHGHRGPVAQQPITEPAVRAELGQQLAAARTAALALPTAADALAAGYKRVTPYLPCIGAHYMSFSYVDRTLDPSHPEMVLYDGNGPDAKVVGLSYYLVSPGTAPEGFAGPNDPWHQHIGLCVNKTGVIGSERLTKAECRARGGAKADGSNTWMTHAWVVPGWESPWGTFSGEHPELGLAPAR